MDQLPATRFALLAAMLALALPAGDSYAVAKPESRGLLVGLGWHSPLDPLNVLNPFFLPDGEYRAGHRGVDLAASLGQAVFALESGTIEFVGSVADRTLVTVRHENQWQTSYEPICPAVKKGQRVEASQVIGWLCDPTEPRAEWTVEGLGQSWAGYQRHCDAEQCLHFSLRVEGKYRNPLLLLGGVAASRLLPTGSSP